jgi:hypothetical protein
VRRTRRKTRPQDPNELVGLDLRRRHSSGVVVGAASVGFRSTHLCGGPTCPEFFSVCFPLLEGSERYHCCLSCRHPLSSTISLKMVGLTP